MVGMQRWETKNTRATLNRKKTSSQPCMTWMAHEVISQFFFLFLSIFIANARDFGVFFLVKRSPHPPFRTGVPSKNKIPITDPSLEEEEWAHCLEGGGGGGPTEGSKVWPKKPHKVETTAPRVPETENNEKWRKKVL